MRKWIDTIQRLIGKFSLGNSTRTRELARLARYDQLLGEEMPRDLKTWWQNSREEWPLVAKAVLATRREARDFWAARAMQLMDEVDALKARVRELEVEGRE